MGASFRRAARQWLSRAGGGALWWRVARSAQGPRGPGPVVVLPPVTLASQPFAPAFPVPATGGPTDGQIRAPRPCRLSSCPRGPWARRPHEQSLPLAQSPVAAVPPAWGVRGSSGPTLLSSVLRARSPARGRQSGQQQGLPRSGPCAAHRAPQTLGTVPASAPRSVLVGFSPWNQVTF